MPVKRGVKRFKTHATVVGTNTVILLTAYQDGYAQRNSVVRRLVCKANGAFPWSKFISPGAHVHMIGMPGKGVGDKRTLVEFLQIRTVE